MIFHHLPQKMSRTTPFITTWIVLLLCVHSGWTRDMGQELSEQDLRNTRGRTQKQQQQQHKELLSKAIGSLLGIEDGMTGRPPLDTAAPRYMQQLYEQYRQGFVWGQRTANTVRSIRAEIGLVKGVYTFVFNLSSISDTERVFNADLHVYRKKPKRGTEPEDIIMHLREVAPSSVDEVGVMRMHARGHGWHAFDVTTPVKDCRDGRRRPSHALAVGFDDGQGNDLPPKDFMQKLHRPFLIVFSNDTQNITLDHIDPYLNPTTLREHIVDPETGFDTLLKNRNFKPNRKNRKSKQTSSRKRDKTDKEARSRRSIDDNEIPEVANDIPPPVLSQFNVPVTNPGVLQSKKVHVQPQPELEPEESGEDSSSEESRLIPYPKDYKETKRRRRRKKNRRNKDRTLPLPKEWERLAEQESHVATVDDVQRQCGRRRLVVDFADIGWSDWIISPKSFEANYCAGTCSFPLTKGSRPSNHATIQSLVNAIGLQRDVPTPCCVPDSMSSVTLLYFDQHWNAVLKNYPAMSVQSCACR